MTKSQAKQKAAAEGKDNDKLINIPEFSTLRATRTTKRAQKCVKLIK